MRSPVGLSVARRYPRRITQSLAIAGLALAAWGCGSSDASSPARATPSERAVPEAPTASTACTDAPECRLTHRGCCAGCAMPELAEVAAVSGAALDSFRAAECPEPGVCAACEAPTNPSLFATCVDGACVAVDVRASELSACTTDDECIAIRRDCCNCDPRRVAVRDGQQGAYYRAQCGETPLCSPCSPDDGPSPPARCEAGHCAVGTATREGP